MTDHAKSAGGVLGRTVLITGAAQRIGRAIALEFARRGWAVAVHYRSSADPASRLIRELRSLGVQAADLKANLADIAETEALIPACAEALGAPSCLVNNASLFEKDDLVSLDAQSWHAHMDANLRAPVLLAQSFARHLPENGDGLIVNIVDQRVLKPSPEFFSYSVSKAGLWWVTRTMAQALAPRIRVNAVAPGPVLPSIHQTGEDFDAEMKATLLQRGASPEEIAAAVLFLTEVPSITGQMICVDGGQHLS
jgi:NAD(P)-dependent dehydrogenase (short-subunit alcohol dehydrogenase family)